MGREHYVEGRRWVQSILRAVHGSIFCQKFVGDSKFKRSTKVSTEKLILPLTTMKGRRENCKDENRGLLVEIEDRLLEGILVS